MRENKLTLEHSLYWLAFTLALLLRMVQLGAAPLTDSEAGWALQALHLAHGVDGILGAQPAYILLTSQLFSIFGDSNFLARLLPALAGSLIVWLPFLLRGWMGDSPWLHRAGLVMAFGLALDPGLVSLSRQAGSLMPALAFTLLSLACLFYHRMIWGGIFAGLALLSGPAFLQGTLILGLSWVIWHQIGRRFTFQQEDHDYSEIPNEAISGKSIAVAVSACVGTVFVAGTLFLRAPQGLEAWVTTFPAYFKTWVSSSGIPILRLPASLLIYQPLALIFGIIAAVSAWIKAREYQYIRPALIGLSIYALIGLLLPVFYAGRQVGDIAWALIPLWALASIEVSRSFVMDEDKTTRLVAAGLVLVLFILTSIGWINLLKIGRYQVNIGIYWTVIAIAVLLGFIALLLVATTISTFTARLGLSWGLCLILGLQLISNVWGVTILRPGYSQELWTTPPAIGQADQLKLTLADLSSLSTGLRDQLEIVVLADPPGHQWDALQWELRSYPNIRFVAALAAAESPPVIITLKEAEQPSLAEKYRGQDFAWHLYPGWQGVFPPNFISWLAFRQAPLGQGQIVLWARADVFPDTGSEVTGSAAP
jgi:hypothetical protein